METSINQEHKALTGTRVSIALLIGFFFTQIWHACSLESFYLEALLAVIGVVIFPYLTYLRKSFRWLFLVYGTVILIAFHYIYMRALHTNMIPAFLMTGSSGTNGQTYEILQIEDHYKEPQSVDEDYIEGHRYGWEVNLIKFSFAPNGQIYIINDKGIKEFYRVKEKENGFYKKFLTKEELKEKNAAFKLGMKDGSRAAIDTIKSYSKKLRKADQQVAFF